MKHFGFYMKKSIKMIKSWKLRPKSTVLTWKTISIEENEELELEEDLKEKHTKHVGVQIERIKFSFQPCNLRL